MNRGRLRLYIGAAAGVGTTYSMLDEAIRRIARGTHVRVGWVDAHSRPNTLKMLKEIVPIEELPDSLQIDRILESHPQVVLIDDLSSTSDGTPHWKFLDTLLDNGIDVIATVNVQCIESLSDKVEEILGRKPPATIPDRILFGAEQIEMVDITPEAIRRRIAHGNVFTSDDMGIEDAELFNSDAFARLRSLLMNWMSQYVDSQLIASRSLRDKTLVLLNNIEENDVLLYQAARSAHQNNNQLIGLYVETKTHESSESKSRQRKEKLQDLGGSYFEVFSQDVPSALLTFAESEGITHIVANPSIVTQSRVQRVFSPLRQRERIHPVFGFFLASALLPLLTLILVSQRTDISVPTSLSLYLLTVVGISAIGGWLPGLLSAVVAPLLANWFLIPPYHTLRINDGDNLVELIVFVSISAIVSVLISVAARRSSEAQLAWREASTLSALADSRSSEALDQILELLRETFQFTGVSVISESNERQEVLVSCGDSPPHTHQDADFSSPITANTYIAANGKTLQAVDQRILHAFLTHLSRVIEQQRLQEIEMESMSLSRANELRTAILRAVSHDLRSPLASIKASISSLRQTDVEWPPDVEQEFLSSIESETDRLTGIITNLLDLSRLDAGVIEPHFRSLSLEEVIPAVVHGLSQRREDVDVDIPETLSELSTDPALLERALSNLIENALKWSSPLQRVAVRVYEQNGKIQIHIVDNGPGIPLAQREVVTRPFHRLTDASVNGGLGLGLAIADRMIAALNGNLELRDTPGGGLTAVVTLPCHRGDLA